MAFTLALATTSSAWPIVRRAPQQAYSHMCERWIHRRAPSYVCSLVPRPRMGCWVHPCRISHVSTTTCRDAGRAGVDGLCVRSLFGSSARCTRRAAREARRRFRLTFCRRRFRSQNALVSCDQLCDLTLSCVEGYITHNGVGELRTLCMGPKVIKIIR